MALINCPDCNKEISDKAVACNDCGCPVVNETAESTQQTSNPNQELYYSQLLKQNTEAAESAAISSLYAGIGGFFLGWILSAIAVVQGNKAIRLGYTGKKAITGKILGAISLVINLPTVFIIYSNWNYIVFWYINI